MVLTRSAAKKGPAPQKYSKVEEMPKGKGKAKAGEPTKIKAIKKAKDEDSSSSYESEPEKSPESSSSEEIYKSKAKKPIPKKKIIKSKKEKSPPVSEESSPDLSAPKTKLNKKSEKPVTKKPKKQISDSSSSYESSSGSPIPKKKNSKNIIPAKRAIKTKQKPKEKSPSPELDQKPIKRSDSPPPLPPKPEPNKKKSPSPSTELPKKPEPSKKKSPSPEPPKIQEAPKEEKIVTTIRKGRAAVDSFFPKAKDCHVYDDGTKVWSSTLNQTDLKTNANKFYIIQLLQSDSDAKQFYVWNRWGRVGYDGQNAYKGPWSELDRAKAEYQKKLTDKTRGGYVELEIMYNDEEEKTEKAEEKIVKKEEKEEKEVESKLDRRIQDLIKLIFDLNAMKQVLAEIGYDAKKMPLGKLSTNNLKQGLEILKQIESVLDGRENSSLEGLSSKFYSLIPHDFGFTNVCNFIINSRQRLQEKITMIESLTDMKIATNIIESKAVGSPIDQHYLRLNCDITPIEKNDPTFAILSEYVSNTHAKTHNSYGLTILEIFRLHKAEEDERFTKDIGNSMLLWHGSRLTNWAGILSQGLRIAPPEAPVSGYMFGKGVYFADMVSKSANYCFTNRENNIGIMLLCEVAVGTPCMKMTADCNAANLPPGAHSTKGCGRNAPPATSYIDFEGCKVPIGNGEETGYNGSLLYNEYIVYDVKQVKMKFLFKMRFDYKFT
ncbi:unnamed protein product [Blepharisma stoltei]|uniref:Poly [ADP-ribose] polymerase n=1 Tax=Blepharisma stoltei TaxID=1481888 RepID=A0AAU9I8Q8_9CILI|nr:unnamed protein product [Blepharisma stoltei]